MSDGMYWETVIEQWLNGMSVRSALVWVSGRASQDKRSV